MFNPILMTKLGIVVTIRIGALKFLGSYPVNQLQDQQANNRRQQLNNCDKYIEKMAEKLGMSRECLMQLV